MQPHLLAAIGVLATIAQSVAAQTREIPIIDLGNPVAVARDVVGSVNGVRELSDGRVLVNDAQRLRLLMLDRSLATAAVIADSMPGDLSYGNRSTSIIPFDGDSTLLVDLAGRSYLVLDSRGALARVMSPARPGDLQFTAGAGFDTRGRMIYRSSVFPHFEAPVKGKPYSPPTFPDSSPLIRADFDTRAADTLAWLRSPRLLISTTYLEGGGIQLSPIIVALSTLDDWTMLPDHTVAILRGQDYHIDWIAPDGTRSSTPRLPFDWKRMTDEEKTALVDSAKANLARQRAGTSGFNASETGPQTAMPGGNPDHGVTIMPVTPSDGGPAPRNTAPSAMTTGIRAEVAPPSELPDYYPPITRTGGMRADGRANVWILPSTSSRSGAGLLYDIVNRKGELFRRVRLPAGRVLQGFGANGAVYLGAYEGKAWRLERYELPS